MTLLAGRYELGDELGAGGMARVVAAHDRRLDRAVAVKLLGSAPDPTTRERFVREARAAARFHHPNAVAVFDTGEHEGQPYIVMERVDGRTLAERLRADGPLSADQALAVVTGILEALAAAHGQGLVHRDVKPANVLLPDSGGVKLADFGIAKALDEAAVGLTTTGAVIGTPSYLAPELVQGRSATPASDVYSVGCVLYELLAGRPPFQGDSAVSVAYAHAHQAAPRIDELRPDVPEHVRATVHRALTKDPEERFVDAAAMRDALEGAEVAAPPPTVPLAGVAAMAGDAPAVTRTLDTEPPARRRWLIAAAASVAAILLVAAVIALADGGDTPQEVDDDPPADEATDDDLPEDGDADADPSDPDDTTDDPPVGDPEPPVDETPGDEQDDAPSGDPSDLPELIRFLAAAEPGTYGEKHGDLLDDLLALDAETDPAERAEEARDLIDDVADWAADDELDQDVAAITREILADVVAGG